MSAQRRKGLTAVVEYVAGLLRAAAASLDSGAERTAARDDPVDEELEQLRRRYPDAPEHWLRTVAIQGGAAAMRKAQGPDLGEKARAASVRDAGQAEWMYHRELAVATAKMPYEASFDATQKPDSSRGRSTQPDVSGGGPLNIRTTSAQQPVTFPGEPTRRHVGPRFHADNPEHRETGVYHGLVTDGDQVDPQAPVYATIEPESPQQVRHEQSAHIEDAPTAAVNRLFDDGVAQLQAPVREAIAMAHLQDNNANRGSADERRFEAVVVDTSQSGKGLELPHAAVTAQATELEFFAEQPMWPQLPELPAPETARDDDDFLSPANEETDRWNALPF